MTSGLDKPEVDFLVLADHAEVVGGKLYMMGGGWDVRRIEDFSKPFNMNIAVGVLTPWALANKENKFQLIIEDEDGKKLGPTVDGSFTVGRPSNAIEGQTFRTMVTVGVPVTLPKPGMYRVVVSVRSPAAYEDVVRSTTFVAAERKAGA